MSYNPAARIKAAENGTIIAEWAFPARRGHHAFTWRVMVDEDGSHALASDTHEQGDYSVFIFGMTRREAFRTAERSARRCNATRVL